MDSGVQAKARRHYVSRACVSCRLRKVKCSGERPCRRCKDADEGCEDATSRRGHAAKRRIASSRASALSELLQTSHEAVTLQQLNALQQQQPSTPGQYMLNQNHIQPRQLDGDTGRPQASEDDPEMIAIELQMLSKQPRMFLNDRRSFPGAQQEVSLREQSYRNQTPSTSPSAHTVRPGGSHVVRLLDSLAERVTAVEQSHFEPEAGTIMEEDTETQNHTSLSRTIEVLDSTLRANPQSDINLSNEEETAERVDFDAVTNAPSPEHNIIHCNVTGLRHALAIYFAYINPNLPFLNENQFRAQFENFLVTGGRELDSWSKDLFIVLVNLMYAETMLLSKEHTGYSPVPGWSEFRFADRILSRLSWLNKGNIQFIQCLMLRARFLSTTQRIRSAYDTMSKAVQICYHIGLHDQQCYPASNPFETTMRQRVFWSLFYLDHGIALNAGFPCLLREPDFNVDFPKRIDDKALFPNHPLPEESPVTCVPYLESLSRWAKLSSKICDNIFSVNAPKPASAELIASLDSDILYSLCQLPPTLWWDPSVLKEIHADDFPPYIRRQMCLLHLHTNHLRLIMRHKSIVTLKSSRKVAEESAWIAKDSIEAVDSYRACCLPHQLHRHSAVMYLTVSIIPLICVIIQENDFCGQREEIVQSFLKALEILQDMAPTFMLAQHMLLRLSAAIKIAKQAIGRGVRVAMNHNSSLDAVGDVEISKSLLGLFDDLEGPPNDVLGAQYGAFGMEGQTSAINEDLQLDDLDMYMINAGVNDQSAWLQSAPIV